MPCALDALALGAGSLAAGSLSGPVSYAIIIAWLVMGRNIRTMGNCNPGTANVGRSVGKGWAALVFGLDLLKGLGPMLLARHLLLPGASWWEGFLLAGVGMAAILGHCRPVPLLFSGRLSFGGHPWYVPAIVFTLSLFVLSLNLPFMGQRIREIRDGGGS
jgi:glycerol-3-phosphate acyltransferase PlsY